MYGLTRKIPANRYYALVVAVLVLVAVLYLGRLGLDRNLGFPLDDGWIHQTYARNLVRYRQFAYIPGRPSAGSTAPLWTILVAPAYLLGVDPLAWSYISGLLLFFLLGLGVFRLGVCLFPDRPGWAALASLAVLLDWHLAWAAFSGMETVLFACGVVWLLERYMTWEISQNEERQGERQLLHTPFVLGILSGALVLVRPEGLLPVALLAIAGILVRRRRLLRRSLSIAMDGAAGMALSLIPYVVFNLLIGGSFFPNTFRAKQAEYAVLLQLPLWVRCWHVLKPTLVGAQVVLLPGVACALFCLLRPCQALPVNPRLTRYTRLVPFLWWMLTWLVYAIRLPVNYQHGRYLMPILPILTLYGVIGTLAWLRPRSPRLLIRVVSRAVPWIVLLLLAGFLLLGARAFAHDVGVINGEMVTVAHWLNANTSPDAVVAAHDIGAIGYHTRRPLLDLAGLVTPEIVPFIRDESRLLEFMLERQANYLVTFPSWYPEMVADERLKLEYQTGCARTREQGGENMAVYKLLP